MVKVNYHMLPASTPHAERIGYLEVELALCTVRCKKTFPTGSRVVRHGSLSPMQDIREGGASPRTIKVRERS